MKNIIVRSISGAVYVGLLIGSLLYSNLAFSLILFLLNIVGLYEFYRLDKNIGKNILLLVIIGALLYSVHSLWLENLIASKWLWSVLFAPIFFAGFFLFSEKKEQIKSISNSLYGLLYVTMPLCITNQLNYTDNSSGMPLVLIVFVLIWVNDTFAFLSGMAIGRNKLFERISPKKTWEGFFGGVFATVLVAWFFYQYTGFSSLLQWLLLSVIISAASVIGDFIESMFKRNAGVKDSGKIIPGHGGVLDRIDSLLFVFPVVFLYIQLY